MEIRRRISAREEKKDNGYRSVYNYFCRPDNKGPLADIQQVISYFRD